MVYLVSEVVSLLQQGVDGFCVHNGEWLGDRPHLLSCFQRFDTKVDETLCQILQVPDTESNICPIPLVVCPKLAVDSALPATQVLLGLKVTYYTVCKFLGFLKNITGIIACWR